MTLVFLRRVWEGWKKIALWIGDKQATLIYTILYVVVLGPVALVRRALTDPLLARARRRDSYWLPRVTPPPTLESARRQ